MVGETGAASGVGSEAQLRPDGAEQVRGRPIVLDALHRQRHLGARLLDGRDLAGLDPGHQDAVARRQGVTLAPECVAHQTLDPVAADGAGIDLARHRLAQARRRRGEPVHAEITPVDAFALGEATLELGGQAHPLGAPVAGVVWRVHTQVRHGRRRRRVAGGVTGSDADGPWHGAH